MNYRDIPWLVAFAACITAIGWFWQHVVTKDLVDQEERRHRVEAFCAAFNGADAVVESCATLMFDEPDLLPRLAYDGVVRPCTFAGMPSVCEEPLRSPENSERTEGLHVFVLVTPQRLTPYAHVFIPSEVRSRYRPLVAFLDE